MNNVITGTSSSMFFNYDDFPETSTRSSTRIYTVGSPNPITFSPNYDFDEIPDEDFGAISEVENDILAGPAVMPASDFKVFLSDLETAMHFTSESDFTEVVQLPVQSIFAHSNYLKMDILLKGDFDLSQLLSNSKGKAVILYGLNQNGYVVRTVYSIEKLYGFIFKYSVDDLLPTMEVSFDVLPAILFDTFKLSK